MKVFEEPAKLILPQAEGRSVGVHISDVIRDYAFTSRVLDKKWIREALIEDQNTTLMQLGLAFEDYLEKSNQHPEIEYHPGELFVDDLECCECGHVADSHTLEAVDCSECPCCFFTPLRIFMSPDGISSNGVLFLHEIKLTKKSSREFLQKLRLKAPKVLMYIWQVQCYCYALKTLEAKLHVAFAAGNYSYDTDDEDSMASYKIFRFEFTQEEIDENWEKFRNHARHMAQQRSLAA